MTKKWKLIFNFSLFCAKVEYEVSALGEELTQLKDQITSLKNTAISLKTELKEFRSEMKKQIKSVDITRPEASFSFEVDELSEFAKIDGNWHYSDKFWCRSMPWCIGVKSDHGNGQKTPSKTLGFYLLCENNDRSNVEWSCEVDFKMTLYSNLPNKNLVREASQIFNQKIRCSFQCSKNFSSIIDKKNGYTTDDKITLGVEIKVGPMVRG